MRLEHAERIVEELAKVAHVVKHWILVELVVFHVEDYWCVVSVSRPVWTARHVQHHVPVGPTSVETFHILNDIARVRQPMLPIAQIVTGFTVGYCSVVTAGIS